MSEKTETILESDKKGYKTIACNFIKNEDDENE